VLPVHWRRRLILHDHQFNLKAIKPGSRVIYAKAAGATGLDTNIVLDTGSGNQAFGHVILDFASGTGTVTLNGGTGHSGTSTPR